MLFQKIYNNKNGNRNHLDKALNEAEFVKEAEISQSYVNLISIWKISKLVVVPVFVSKSRKSSHWRCSIKIGVLTWKFSKFRGTFLCKSLFFNKVPFFIQSLFFFNFFYRILIKDCWKSWLNGLFGTDVYKKWLSGFSNLLIVIIRKISMMEIKIWHPTFWNNVFPFSSLLIIVLLSFKASVIEIGNEICVHIKIMPSKFRILNPKHSRVIYVWTS